MLQGFTLSRTIRTALLAGTLVVWLPSLGAQMFDSSAKVLVETGQVSILQDGYQIPVYAGKTVIKPHSVIVSGPDGYAKLQTSDGSTFEVFPNARVTFRDNYPSLTDYIQVWMGRIRVQIDHHKGPNDNRVSTPTAVISVRGTIFDVVDEDQDDTTLVTVEEGLVNVRHLLVPSEILLHDNESVRIFRDQPIARVTDHNGVIRAALDHLRQAALDALYTHPGGIGGGHGPVGVPTGGTQGDKKGGSTSGGTPGTPPPPPGGGN